MTQGGARSRSGPAPDPSSIRSGTRSWTTLPADGYDGEIPEWPLDGQSHREAEVWDLHWRKPQAVRWAADQMELQVALYVRRWVEAEKPDSAVALSTLVRQYADDLGMTKSGMDRLLWRIAERSTAPALTVVDAAPAPADMSSARSRLRK